MLPGMNGSAVQGPNAAVLLQLGQLQAQQQALAAATAAGHGREGLDKETSEKAEMRKARRMLSNRESARRSRKRKQEHLNTLEHEKTELAQLKEDTDRHLNAKQALVDALQVKVDKFEEENRALKEEISKLKDEVSLSLHKHKHPLFDPIPRYPANIPYASFFIPSWPCATLPALRHFLPPFLPFVLPMA
jgi:hypothetical protein